MQNKPVGGTGYYSFALADLYDIDLSKYGQGGYAAYLDSGTYAVTEYSGAGGDGCCIFFY